MNSDLEITKKLKIIREEKTRLMKKESELCTPKLTNLKYIPMIHKWFYEFVGEREEFTAIQR